MMKVQCVSPVTYPRCGKELFEVDHDVPIKLVGVVRHRQRRKEDTDKKIGIPCPDCGWINIFVFSSGVPDELRPVYSARPT